MRRGLIIGGAILGVFVVAIAVLLVWATINLNSIIAARRTVILAKASNTLGRKVEIASIRASVGWGVSIDLSGVMIADDPAFSATPTLTVDDIYCRVEFLPLLSRDLRITSLTIANPELRLIRDSSGRLNISTIGKSTDVSTDSQPAATSPPQSAAPASGAAAPGSGSSAGNPMQAAPIRNPRDTDLLNSLYIRDFAVTDGTISYSDSTSAENPIVVKNFDFSIDDFQIDSPFDISLALAAFSDSQNFKISGTAGPILSGARIDILGIPIALGIDVGPITLANVRAVAPLEKAIPPNLSISGDLSAHGKAVGTSGALNIDIASDLAANQVDYSSQAGHAPIFDKPAGVPLTIATAATGNTGSFVFDRAEVTLAGLILKITKVVVGGGKLSARLASNRFEVAPVAALIAPIRRFNATGAAELHADVTAAKGARPQIRGIVGLAGVGFSPGGKLPAISDLNGDMTISGNSAEADPLEFVLGGGRARLKVRANSIQPIDASYSLEADRIRPSLLAPSRPANELIRNLRVSGTFSGTSESPKASATVATTAGMVNGVEYTNLALAMQIAGPEIMVQSLRVGAFGGTIAAAARADLAGARRFEVNADLDNIEVRQALASQKSRAANIVRGLMTGTVHVAGAGSNFDEMKPTLRGNGTVAIRNGKLIGVNVVKSALKKVNDVPGIGALIPMEVIANHPELFQNPDTDIDQASLSFILAGPRITTDDLTVTAADYVIDGNGWFDMDKNIDMAAHILLTQAFSSEIQDARKNVVYLENHNGQVDIPLRIMGQLPKPTVAPDINEIVQRAATQAIRRKGQKFFGQLGGFLNGGGSGGNENNGGGGGNGGNNNNPANFFKNLF